MKALISLTAFGAAEVRRHGQAWFARLSHAAGADGIEVRGELLREEPESEIEELTGILAESGMSCVYSSPAGLWDTRGRFDEAALHEGLARAHALGAGVLKMSIGHFGAGDAPAWQALGAALAAGSVQLLVENSQEACSGGAAALDAFFGEADARLPGGLGMTFDMGNWHWVGESPLDRAHAYAARVRYIHCKGVFRRPDKWVAVPLAQSAAPWRAILRALPAGAMRAIEYPLIGDDLLVVTRAALDELRHAD